MVAMVSGTDKTIRTIRTTQEIERKKEKKEEKRGRREQQNWMHISTLPVIIYLKLLIGLDRSGSTLVDSSRTASTFSTTRSALTSIYLRGIAHTVSIPPGEVSWILLGRTSSSFLGTASCTAFGTLLSPVA